MDLDLISHWAGVLLPVKVLPNSKTNSFRGLYDRALKISVTAVAENGKANKAVLAFLAKQLSISKSGLSIESGETDCRKTILLQGVTESELLGKLSRVKIG